MGIDIGTSRKWMDLNKQAQSIIPSLMDEASKSGDYTQVSRANQLMDKISALGEHHATQIQRAQQQDQAQGMGGLYPVMASGQDEAPQPPPPGNLPSLDPQAFGKPNAAATAHEAARGAAKGVMEAEQGKDAASSALDDVLAAGKESALPSMGYGPGQLKLEAQRQPAPSPEEQARVAAGGSLGYGPGELSLQAQNEATPPQTALPDFTEEKADEDVFRDVISKYPKGSPDRQKAINDYFDMVREDQGLRPDMSTLPLSPEPKGDAMAALDDVLAAAETGRKMAGDQFAENMGRGSSALPEFATEEATPGPTEEDLARVVPAAQKKYAGNGMAMLNDFAKTAPLDEREREFLRRIQVELGPRPKLATIPKILAALAVGLGSVLAAWVTGKYNGQALMDMSADQQDWDKRRSEIGREVYLAHKLYNRTDMQQKGSMDRAQLLEEGRNERQGAGESGKDRRLENQETGKTSRLQTQEQGRNTRNEANIASRQRIADIRTKSAKVQDRMASGDRAKMEELKMKYNKLDPILLQSDSKTKALGEQILREIEVIIAQYPSKVGE